MKRPFVVGPNDDVTVVGRGFGTPIVVKGNTWIPLVELVVWGIMSWVAGRGRDDRNWGQRLSIGALTTTAILGSEWCHNLAHAGVAWLVGKPVDAVLINYGLPLLQYYDIEDETVTPRQHIARALGGPLFNGLLLPLALLFRRCTRQGSAARDVANAGAGMNAFLCSVSLLPIPGIDGGPILKWSLVERGYAPRRADEVVKQVDQVLGVGLGAAAGVALKRKRWFLGAILGMLGVTALLVGFGLVEE